MKKREQIQTVLSPNETWHLIAIPESQKEWLEMHINAWRFRAALIDVKNYLKFNLEAGLDADIKSSCSRKDVLKTLLSKINGICDGYDIKLP